MVRSFFFLCFVLSCHVLRAQGIADEWMQSQLDKITWQETYKGVLADFHPVTLILASDQSQVAGYLIHDADQRKHRLTGDWNSASRFQLQERDEFDRLTGYLTGTVSNDQAILKWLSADQSRVFDVKAVPGALIKIKNFKTVSEWISVEAPKPIFISVQKLDYGIVSGIVQIDGLFRRFDGQCQDGTCSIWKAEVRDEKGTAYTIQMRQKDPVTYKAVLGGVEYKASIQFTTPLSVRLFDNSVGFLDFVYPKLESKIYNDWISSRVDSIWEKGVKYLTTNNELESPGRLNYRSSGWVEIIDENEAHITGMITFIHPEKVQREVFLWLKKENVFVLQDELMNAPGDLNKASSLALASSDHHTDKDYSSWLQDVGYTMLLPTVGGVAMTTEFNMVYGDEMQLLSMEESKALIKRKYWKYFGW